MLPFVLFLVSVLPKVRAEICQDRECRGHTSGLYSESWNDFISKHVSATTMYVPGATDGSSGLFSGYRDVISDDLKSFPPNISKEMLDQVRKEQEKAVTYQIVGGVLYRSKECLFPMRCEGIQHFLLRLAQNKALPDTEIVVNTFDWPLINRHFSKDPLPLFSFSKTQDYYDIFYPAWTFWAGGPAISKYPKGIGRWDLMRNKLIDAAKAQEWNDKVDKAFFRGSRTSSERDGLILLSRREPSLVDAKYTKNQSWKSKADTLGEDPAEEVAMEEHCQYRYLFNFRGVTASFRFKHLFLCGSTVIHVGSEWKEFFYPALVPWYHYIPMSTEDGASGEKIADMLNFLRENPDIGRTVAINGKRFIEDHLRMEDVERYWDHLLAAYTERLDFVPEKNPQFVEIEGK